VIDKLRRDGELTVFLTTHYMEEAADADYVVILNAGKIAAKGTPVELKNTYTGDFISFYANDEAELAKLGKPLQKIANGYRIEVKNTAEATELIKKYPQLFTDYEVSKGKMDDVFLAATGMTLGD
ncbi:MAG: ABC transporter, partial [Clostridiales bacterium]|nr:ABC transporter [Clostridiales bacterium]